MPDSVKDINAFASQFSCFLAEWKTADPLVKWDKTLAVLVSVKAWDKLTTKLKEKGFERSLLVGILNALYLCPDLAMKLSVKQLYKTVMELINVAPTRSSNTLTMAKTLTPQFNWAHIAELRDDVPAVEFQCSVITNLLGLRDFKRFFGVCPKQRPQVVQLWGYEKVLADSGPKVNMVRDSWFYNIVRDMVILGCRWLAADGILMMLDDGYWVYRHIVKHCVSAVGIKAPVAGADSLLLTDMFCAIVSNIMKTRNFGSAALALIAANSQNLAYILDALMLVLCARWTREDAWNPGQVHRWALHMFPSTADCGGSLNYLFNLKARETGKPEIPVRLIDFVNVWGWRAEVVGGVYPSFPTSRYLTRASSGAGVAPQDYVDVAARFLSFGGGALTGPADFIFKYDASTFDSDILRKPVRPVGDEPLLGVEYWPEASVLNGDALRELERLAIGQEILGSVSVATIQGARAEFVTKTPVNSGVSSTKKPSSKKSSKNHKKKKNAEGHVSQSVGNNKKTQLSVMTIGVDVFEPMGEAVETTNWSALDVDEHRYYKLVTAQGKLAWDCLFCLTQGLKQILLVVVALAVVHRPKLHTKLVLRQRTVSKWAVRLKKISIGEKVAAKSMLILPTTF